MTDFPKPCRYVVSACLAGTPCRYDGRSNLRPEIAEGLVAACAHYGVALVRLEDISKQCGHPDAEGMKQIAAQVGRALDAL